MNRFRSLEEAERDAPGLLRFQIERFASIKPSPNASYLVKGLLQSTGLAVIWGAPKCRKSFWVVDLLMHVALGWKYRGRRSGRERSCIALLKARRAFETVLRPSGKLSCRRRMAIRPFISWRRR